MNTYIGSTINDSSTITAFSAAEIEEARGKIVKFNDDGKVEVCTSATDPLAGVIILQGEPDVAENEDITVQIKDIGIVRAGGEIKKGEYVTSDAEGKAVKASSGNNILGMATRDGVTDGFVTVQIVKTIASV